MLRQRSLLPSGGVGGHLTRQQTLTCPNVKVCLGGAVGSLDMTDVIRQLGRGGSSPNSLCRLDTFCVLVRCLGKVLSYHCGKQGRVASPPPCVWGQWLAIKTGLQLTLALVQLLQVQSHPNRCYQHPWGLALWHSQGNRRGNPVGCCRSSLHGRQLRWTRSY